MKETSARLLRLLTLLQTRREWPGAELAGRLAQLTPHRRREIIEKSIIAHPHGC